ncbi:hypothetical protein ACFQX7_27060 [Luedemannella flava]
MDQPSEMGQCDPAAGVIYPELHSRLISWYLVHAWRAVDLAQDSLYNLGSWRITSGAVTVRALIEEAACLLDECTKLTTAWEQAKQTPPDPVARPDKVRSLLAQVLTEAGFSSRLKDFPELPKATNILTYVARLVRATGDERYRTWYDWLSDAAHPAFGARIALASPPMAHQTGAVVERYYARSPLSMRTSSGGEWSWTTKLRCTPQTR